MACRRRASPTTRARCGPERVSRGRTTPQQETSAEVQVEKVFEYTQRAHYEVRACAGIRVGDLGARWDKRYSVEVGMRMASRATRYISGFAIRF